MNVVGLGNKLTYDRWDLYIDFLHHALATDDWGKNFCVVSCANYKALSWLNIFAKGGYETNHSVYEYSFAEYAVSGLINDVLSRPETDAYFIGGGFEIVPSICKAVRFHGFLCHRHEEHPDVVTPGLTSQSNELTANVGVTWFMDIHRIIRDRFRENAVSLFKEGVKSVIKTVDD